MNLDKLIKIANYFDKNKQFNNADFISKYLKIASDTDEGDSIESIIEGIQKKIEPLVGQPQLIEPTPTVRERVPFQRAQEEYLELKSKIISKTLIISDFSPCFTFFNGCAGIAVLCFNF